MQEQAYLDARSYYDVNDQGYSEIICTRPDTIAAALADSPAGLAAWIIDKYRDWSDCAGDLESRWDEDTLLIAARLYWATGSIGTSFRQHYNYPLNEPVPDITVPAAITLINEPAGAEASAGRRHDIAEYDWTVLSTCRARGQHPEHPPRASWALALSMATAR